MDRPLFGKKNVTAAVLMLLGAAILLIGFIVGMYLSWTGGPSLMLITWGITLIVAFIFFALAEIIELLDKMNRRNEPNRL